MALHLAVWQLWPLQQPHIFSFKSLGLSLSICVWSKGEGRKWEPRACQCQRWIELIFLMESKLLGFYLFVTLYYSSWMKAKFLCHWILSEPFSLSRFFNDLIANQQLNDPSWKPFQGCICTFQIPAELTQQCPCWLVLFISSFLRQMETDGCRGQDRQTDRQSSIDFIDKKCRPMTMLLLPNYLVAHCYDQRRRGRERAKG